ncbi:DUF4145 domain-containing protein [Paenibacillus sp. FSL R7-0652]|uniref:DUF4145 domain-containing protein n=1 Tax=Paenibacillus sp. FSL R7-0652 TaxID=2921687 RepID=UPI00315A446D
MWLGSAWYISTITWIGGDQLEYGLLRKENFTENLPALVSISLDESEKCFIGKAYLACVVMCGRVLEAICKDKQVTGRNLADGLKELLDTQIIDNRIFEWGEALRIHRNMGAHATEVEITKEDARDLLDFSIAICDYIYVLTSKFEEFQARRQNNSI